MRTRNWHYEQNEENSYSDTAPLRSESCMFQTRDCLAIISCPASKNQIPCEQRLHFRGMSWRVKSSLCQQPLNVLSCMQNNRHFCRQICESLIRRNQTYEQLCSSFCFFFLCLSPSGFKSVLAKNLPKKKKTPLIFSDRLFKEVLSALREAHSIQTAVFRLIMVVIPSC